MGQMHLLVSECILSCFIIVDFLQWQSFPTVQTGIQHIQERVELILDKIAGLPLERTVDNADALLVELRALS